MWRTPRWARASTTALAMAGGAPTVADSPTPLAPNGWYGEGVRSLGRHVDRQLSVHPVEVGDAAAGLDGRDVDARDVQVLRHHDLGLGERALRAGAVADPPVPDVIVVLVLLVGAEDRRARLQRLLRVDHHR